MFSVLCPAFQSVVLDQVVAKVLTVQVAVSGAAQVAAPAVQGIVSGASQVVAPAVQGAVSGAAQVVAPAVQGIVSAATQVVAPVVDQVVSAVVPVLASAIPVVSEVVQAVSVAAPVVAPVLVGVAGVAFVGWGLIKLFSSSGSGSKGKMMKAPGRNYRMPRKEFEKSPSDYFRDLHKK